MSDFSEASVLIVVTDLDRFAAESARRDDLEVARGIQAYYELATNAIETAGGRVVKFIGDGVLAVFSEADAERGVIALLALKDRCDRLMRDLGWKSELLIRAHFGTVVTGEFGNGSSRRFDIIGKNVNLTFRLDATGVSLSAEAFRQLSSNARQHFKKHTPPITYIRSTDDRQPRWSKR